MNADEGSRDEQTGAANADGVRECAWHGADDQDGASERHVDDDHYGGGGDDGGLDANSNWQQLQQPRLHPAD